MQSLRTAAQEALEDIFFGQVVVIWARWFIILTGTILALWSAANEVQLTATILPIAALMGMNFFLHGRYLTEKPANRVLLLASSALDLGIVTALVLLGPVGHGLSSPLFVLYYPVILAFCLVFPPRPASALTAAALVAYAASCFLADPAFVANMSEIKQIAMRLITLAAAGGLATYYWRIQRDRRRATEGAATATNGLFTEALAAVD
jgi:hypothetical protein